MINLTQPIPTPEQSQPLLTPLQWTFVGLAVIYLFYLIGKYSVLISAKAHKGRESRKLFIKLVAFDFGLLIFIAGLYFLMDWMG